MKKIQCEVCGSIYIKKTGDNLFECESCGCQYSGDDLKKLLIEISGKVKIDKTQEIDNTLKLAFDAYAGGNYQQAYSYFSIVLQSDYQNSDATFMKGLCSAYQSTLANISVNELFESTVSALNIKIKDKNVNLQDIADFKIRMASDITSFAIYFQSKSIKHINEFPELKSAALEFLNRSLLLTWLVSFASSLMDFDTYEIRFNQAEKFYWIANNGLLFCQNARNKLRYKNGTATKRNFVDGKPYLIDIFATAELSATDLSNVALYEKNFKNILGYPVLHQRNISIKENERKKAEAQKYWDEHPKEYQEYIEQIRLKEKEDNENRLKKEEADKIEESKRVQQKILRDKKIRKFVIIFGVIAIIGIIVTLIIFNIFIPSQNYSKAIEYQSSSDPYNAMTYFEKAGYFKDSKQQLDSLRSQFYNDALAKIENTDYQAAQKILETIPNYSDSGKYLTWCMAMRFWKGDIEIGMGSFDLSLIEDFLFKKLVGTWIGDNIEFVINDKNEYGNYMLDIIKNTTKDASVGTHPNLKIINNDISFIFSTDRYGNMWNENTEYYEIMCIRILSNNEINLFGYGIMKRK